MSEDEKHRVHAQVDHFIDILARRYNLTPNDVVDAVNWVKQKKEISSRMKMSGAFSLMGIIIGALLLALWEGFKAVLGSRP